MKWLGIILLLVTHNYFCMHGALHTAISESNFQKVENLLGQYTQLCNQDFSEASALQVPPVDFNALHKLAIDLKANRKAQTETINHSAVYKRILVGSGSILIGFFMLGNPLYQSITTKMWNFENLIASATAGVTAIGHGYKEIKLGVQNQDANNAHAQHLAIIHMLAAKNEKTAEVV